MLRSKLTSIADRVIAAAGSAAPAAGPARLTAEYVLGRKRCDTDRATNAAAVVVERATFEGKKFPKRFDLFWSPEGRKIATVEAETARAAVRKAPAPYSKYLGEIFAEEVDTRE